MKQDETHPDNAMYTTECAAPNGGQSGALRRPIGNPEGRMTLF
jgi:hypothetical protein